MFLCSVLGSLRSDSDRKPVESSGEAWGCWGVPHGAFLAAMMGCHRGLGVSSCAYLVPFASLGWPGLPRSCPLGSVHLYFCIAVLLAVESCSPEVLKVDWGGSYVGFSFLKCSVISLVLASSLAPSFLSNPF